MRLSRLAIILCVAIGSLTNLGLGRQLLVVAFRYRICRNIFYNTETCNEYSKDKLKNKSIEGSIGLKTAPVCVIYR